MSRKSSGLAQAYTQLQNEKLAIERQHQQKQAQDRQKLLPIKTEYEQVLKELANKLNDLALVEPRLLDIDKHWLYRMHPSPLFRYNSSGKYTDTRFHLDYRLDIVIKRPPKNTLFQKIASAFSSPYIALKPEVNAMAAGTSSSGWGWSSFHVPLGEIVVNPSAPLRDEEYARARLYETQVECLERLKELLDDTNLAQAVNWYLFQFK